MSKNNNAKRIGITGAVAGALMMFGVGIYDISSPEVCYPAQTENSQTECIDNVEGDPRDYFGMGILTFLTLGGFASWPGAGRKEDGDEGSK